MSAVMDNAPWIRDRLALTDRRWRDSVPDPWQKHLERWQEAADIHGIPLYLAADTAPEVVEARDVALKWAFDYWDLQHVRWRITTGLPLRDGDPTSIEEIEVRLVPVIPAFRAALDTFRLVYQPQRQAALATAQAAARQRTIARRRTTKPLFGPTTPTKPIEEMTIEEYLAHLFPPLP